MSTAFSQALASRNAAGRPQALNYAVMAPGQADPETLEGAAAEDLLLVLPREIAASLLNPRCLVPSAPGPRVRVVLVGGVVRWLDDQGAPYSLGESDAPFPELAQTALKSIAGLPCAFVDPESGELCDPCILQR